MSGPFPERLSRFTPDAGSLDPAAVLFAAGRRSARPNRGWIALAAALAVSQGLTLALLWHSPAAPVAPLPPPAAGSHEPPAPPESPSTDVPDSPGLWTVRHGLRDTEAEAGPGSVPAVTIPDGGPPLRAFGPPPPSILN
jgi:hypothetical protein